MHNPAFFGTGQCDPNKGLIEAAAFAGFIIGWVIVFNIVKKVGSSSRRESIKTLISFIIILMAICGSIALFLMIWLGLACSG